MISILNIGCGLTITKSGINIDSSLSLTLSRIPIINKLIKNLPCFPKEVNYGDIVKGLKYDNNSFDVIYCSHMLEHLTRDDFIIALYEIKRLLKSNGAFRFVIPDIKFILNKYTDSENISDFLNESGLGYMQSKVGFINSVKYLLTNSKHEWLWSYTELESILLEMGFTRVRRAYYGDSKFMSELADIEIYDRWLNSLGIECVK